MNFQVKAVPLSQIIFKKPKKTDFHLSADPAPLDYNLVIESPDSFLQKLKQTNSTAVIFTVTDPIPNPPIPNPALPKLLTSLYRSEFCSLSKTELSSRYPDILEEIHVTLEEATNLEKLTQSLCTQWHTHRA